MFKLKISFKFTYDLYIGFDCDRVRRQPELTNRKFIIARNHVRIMLKDVSCFKEHQEKATFGLGHKLTLTRNNNVAVLDKTGKLPDARSKIDNIHWYLLHYTPSISQHVTLFEPILRKTPIEQQYNERSVFMKDVNDQNL